MNYKQVLKEKQKRRELTSRKRYLRGDLTHEGYYLDEREANKVAKKHNGYVRRGTGMYSNSFEVFAPVSIWQRQQAKIEARREAQQWYKARR